MLRNSHSSFRALQRYSPSNSGDVERTPEIASIYIKLMSFGGDVFVNDPALMTMWLKFTERNPESILEILK